MVISIPYPPTGNSTVRHGGGRHYLTDDVKRYRMNVAIMAKAQCDIAYTGPISVVAEIYPPDNKRRDLDNVWKTAGDALTHAGVWLDDFQIQDLRLIRMEKRNGGHVVINIAEVDNG